MLASPAEAGLEVYISPGKPAEAVPGIARDGTPLSMNDIIIIVIS